MEGPRSVFEGLTCCKKEQKDHRNRKKWGVLLWYFYQAKAFVHKGYGLENQELRSRSAIWRQELERKNQELGVPGE